MNELLTKYFEGTLSPEEQILFEQQRNSDADFRAELDFHTALQRAVKVSERQKIKDQVQTFESEQKKRMPLFRLHKLFPYAAVLALILSGLLYVYIQQNRTDALYAAYFEPYPNIERSTLRSDVPRSLASEAFTAYDLEDYKRADSLLTSVLASAPAAEFHFYKGMCLMQLEQYDQAVQQLDAITPEGAPYYTKALWFKALAYLKLRKKEQTKALLQELTTQYTFKNTEAKVLLSKL